uniref:Uncharacterized protein n=1 Tax=viral metagenome TaxID=1070528 RepID=A0A6M3JP60_9ZZZZ
MDQKELKKCFEYMNVKQGGFYGEYCGKIGSIIIIYAPGAPQMLERAKVFTYITEMKLGKESEG